MWPFKKKPKHFDNLYMVSFSNTDKSDNKFDVIITFRSKYKIENIKHYNMINDFIANEYDIDYQYFKINGLTIL